MGTRSHLIALAAALSVLPTAAAASRSNASADRSQTIRFALAFHDVRVDLGEKGPSVGDERIFADSLLDAKGRKVGHDAGVCTFTTLTPPEAACQITFFLPHGEIATQFLNAPPGGHRRTSATLEFGLVERNLSAGTRTAASLVVNSHARRGNVAEHGPNTSEHASCVHEGVED